ncbi:MAG: mannosyltransferase, partial [Acidobacteriota bacterium]|nr:mannosyltransferase [Acidobacteriota bacterium]
MKVKALIFLALFASLISFAKFSHCENSGWATPDQYIHACYSDLPALFGTRGLDNNAWPYTSHENSVEYPVLTGMVMYATSFVANSPVSYFNINIFFLILLFLATVLVVRKIRPEFAYLVPVAPAMIASLFINWDLWAIATMMLAIYWFDRKQYTNSALLLAISISTKFLPIFLIIPIAFIFWRDSKVKELVKYVAIVAGTWIAINAPFALTTPTGWWRFYKLNLERGADWGSIWLALQQLGVNFANLNYLSILLLLIAMTSIAIILFELKYTPTLASVAFLVLASVMVASKVYSPQYVLWLTPLAAIALTNKKDLHAFWIWQAVEMIYHLAIWQHIALVTDAHFGLASTPFAVLTLLRIAGTIYLMAVLARRALQARNTHSQLLDLLFEGSKAYP